VTTAGAPRTSHAENAPSNLWAEDGEILWIRADLADSPTRAKRIAFVGHDPSRRVVLPETYLGGERYGYEYIDCGDAWHLRPGASDEVGWAGRGAETWWKCSADHPQAVAYWPVSV
jgi:hypothetical protein